MKILSINIFVIAVLPMFISSNQLASDRIWYMVLRDQVTHKNTTLINIKSDSLTAFSITNGRHYGYQNQVDYFDLMITVDLEYKDSVFLEWISPGIHPVTGNYIPEISIRYIIPVPINQEFRFYRYLPGNSFFLGAITGSWIRFMLEYGTGDRVFKIHLMNVSGGHTVNQSKPPVTFKVEKKGYRTRRGSRNN